MGGRISNFKLLLHFSNIFHYFVQSYYRPVILRWTSSNGSLVLLVFLFCRYLIFFSVIATNYTRTFYLCKSIYFVYITLCKKNGIKIKLKKLKLKSP